MDKANPNTSRRQDSPMIDDFLDVNQADSDIVTEDSGTSNFMTNSISLEKNPNTCLLLLKKVT